MGPDFTKRLEHVASNWEKGSLMAIWGDSHSEHQIKIEGLCGSMHIILLYELNSEVATITPPEREDKWRASAYFFTSLYSWKSPYIHPRYQRAPMEYSPLTGIEYYLGIFRWPGKPCDLGIGQYQSLRSALTVGNVALLAGYPWPQRNLQRYGISGVVYSWGV